jgi:hypothetical protein
MRISILLFLIFISNGVFGQIGNLWLTEEFWETNDSTTAFYKRVVKSYNSDNTINVTDYLKTGERYFDGSVVHINSGLPVNNFKYFYKSGELKFEGNQTVLKPSGFEKFNTKEYYSNGQLRCESEGTKSKLKIIQSFDSAGVSLLQNGEGQASIEDEYYHLLWKGKIRDFKMDSVWTAIDTRTNRLVHIEYFVKGIFIKGITIQDGQTIKYKEESGYAKPKFLNKVRHLAKTEILSQVPKSERQQEYKVGVLFKQGKPIQIIHLIKKLDEKRINFQNVEIPDYTFLERGIPIESMTLGLKIIKVD